MDLVQTLRFYIDKALKEIPGMKVLLLDQETTSIVSTVYSQSEVLDQEVYLVERIDGDTRGDQLFHLKAVCFLRPTRENIARLRREFREPRFGEYLLFFTNRVEDMRLQDLAEGDIKELVGGVSEMFGDFIALDPHHFTIPLPRPHITLQPISWDFGATSDTISRLTDGLGSLALSLRKRFTVRYQRGSEMCERLAASLHHLTSVEERELFDFGSRGRDGSPLLLIIDRKDDPVTPLLSQWTYQSMIHDLLGIVDNRVDLKHVAGIKPDFAEVTVSSQQDSFFNANKYSNFGDVGMAAKDMVEKWGRQGAAATNLHSIEDMASFVESLPEYSHQQALVYKHVTLMGELSSVIDRRRLMEVSSLEQDVACSPPALSSHRAAVSALIEDRGIDGRDKLRLVALFALRYEKDGAPAVGALLAQLATQGVDAVSLAALRLLLRQSGADQRVQDIFGDRSVSARIAALAKQHLRGVENVYTQHIPPIVSLLEAAVKCKLPEIDYPSTTKETDGGVGLGGGQFGAGGRGGSGAASSISSSSKTTTSSVIAPPLAKSPKVIVLFIVGGTTYEEAKAIAELNAAGERGDGWQAGVRFVLGGSGGVQRSSSFIGELCEVALSERYHHHQR